MPGGAAETHDFFGAELLWWYNYVKWWKPVELSEKYAAAVESLPFDEFPLQVIATLVLFL